MSFIFNSERVYDGSKPNYPLFFGEHMSLNDTIDVQYPELDKLMLKQRSQFWVETSISMSADQRQWPSIPPKTQEISIKNLAWQSQADSIAGRAPIIALMPFVTNPELESLLVWWQAFEQIHARTYTHIIKSVFPDPQVVRDEMANNELAMKRLDVLSREFETMHIMAATYTIDSETEVINVDGAIVKDRFRTYTKKQYMKQLCKTLGALYGLESIQFFASFACTFALAEQELLTGVSDQLKKIAKDEALHTRFTHAILNILAADPEFKDIIVECMPFFEKVMYEIRDLEYSWGDYLFSEGRNIVGFNSELYKEYVDHLCTGSFRAIGLVYDKPNVNNPINWMDKYLDPELIQVAPQERDITNYLIGALSNDMNDEVSFDEYSDF